MPKYHIVKESIDQERLKSTPGLLVDLSSKGFEYATLSDKEGERFILKRCGKTQILIDRRTIRPLNKLHIGEVGLNNAHIESADEHGLDGPRLDLSRFSRTYADIRLGYLKSIIENPEVKESFVLHYAGQGRYSVPHRLRELAATRETIEEMIKETRSISSKLNGNRDEIYQNAKLLEELAIRFESQIVALNSKQTQPADLSKRQRLKPKIIVAENLVQEISEISRLTSEVIESIAQHENFDLDLAGKYWKRVYGLAESVNGMDFAKYSKEIIDHLKRHLNRSQVPGSEFSPIYRNPIQVIDEAFEILKRRYEGRPTVVRAELSKITGLEGVISLNELPSGVEVAEEEREGEVVNVVRGIQKRPTNILTIVAGPAKNGTHGFRTIYPGEPCPPISEDREFWENHALIG